MQAVTVFAHSVVPMTSTSVQARRQAGIGIRILASAGGRTIKRKRKMVAVQPRKRTMLPTSQPGRKRNIKHAPALVGGNTIPGGKNPGEVRVQPGREA